MVCVSNQLNFRSETITSGEDYNISVLVEYILGNFHDGCECWCFCQWNFYPD